MSVIYKTNPWHLPELADYPLWPFNDIDFWHLGNLFYEVRVVEENFPPGVSFYSGSHELIRSRDAFLCAGLLMSPATYNGGPRAWAFFLEHIESLKSNSGKLRLKSDFIYWEERVRTIFAERFGLGLAGWLLWNSYDVLHIADAGPFIAKSINDPSSSYYKKSLQSLKLYGKNGGLKPDLFCLTKTGQCVIAESKAAIGPPSKLTSAKKKGKQQVENVTPKGVAIRPDGGRLVFASNLRHEGENPRFDKDSGVTVVDPDGVEDAISVDLSANEITLHSYCKVLSLCGLPMLARSLLRGLSVNIEQFFRQQVEVNGHNLFPLLQRGQQVLGLEANIAKVLFKNHEELSIHITGILSGLGSTGISSNDNSLLLPNGVVYGEID